jgi:hypothetical protein
VQGSLAAFVHGWCLRAVPIRGRGWHI